MQNVLLLRAFFAMLAGVLAAPLLGVQGWQPWLLVCAVVVLVSALAWLVITARRDDAACGPEILLLCACGLLGVLTGTAPARTNALPQRCGVELTAQLADAVEWQGSPGMLQQPARLYAACMADVINATFHGGTGTAAGERVRLVLESDMPIALARGDVVCVSGLWRRIPAATNPGQFDAAAHFERVGVWYRVTARDGALRWWTPPNLSYRLRVLRRLDAARMACARALHAVGGLDTEAALLRQMMLGTREVLPEEAVLTFERTSTFHIIAISGLNLGIVGGLWYGIAWLCGVPWRWRGVAVLPLLWTYALMVGLSVSVVRATLMFTLFAAAPLVRRMHNAAHTLLVAAFLYVVLVPGQATALGTQLTFLSVLALIAGMPPLDRLVLRWRWVRGPTVYDLAHRHLRWLHVTLHYFVRIACGTVAVWALTWPIIVTKSNIVVPCSWLANLAVVPLLSVVLALCFIALLAAAVSAALAACVQLVNLALLHGMLAYLDGVSRIPWSYVAIRSLTPAALICYYVSLIVTWWWLRQTTGMTPGTPRTRRAVLAGIAVAWLIFGMVLTRDARVPRALRIVTLDVGLGDATAVHGRHGETLIIDGGVRHPLWSAGARVVVPYLRAMGVNTLDAMVCTHFDRDHCGGLYDVLELVRVRTVLAPPVLGPAPPADELRALAAVRGAAWRTMHAGDTAVWRSITVRALSPPAAITGMTAHALARHDNTWSLVLRISSGARAYLATGDATLLSEALQLHAGAALCSDVLKLGHHGSAGSSGSRYLAAVQPAAALLSVGRNSFGLPAPAVLDRMRAAGVPVLRTDQAGAVLVELWPDTLRLYTFLEPCTNSNANILTKSKASLTTL
jgi:competence protein ComEC